MTTWSHNSTSRPIPEVNSERWVDVSEQARSASVPVVIRGLFSAESGLWSPERLAAECGDREVGIAVDLPLRGVPYQEDTTQHHKRMRLSDFFSLLKSGQPCYLNQAPLKDFPALERELNLKELRLGRVFSVNLWVGSKTRSGLHYDNADNLFGQIYGEKRAVLVSPDHSKSLYPFHDNPSKSQVDVDAPDLKRYPKYARVKVWTCELRAGDALYIPRGWWHHLSTQDVSISINCWHGDMLSAPEKMRMFLAGGLGVVWRTGYDFFWHGVVGRPYPPRLFSPLPPGVTAYNRVKAYFK